jgi:short subunit dehydrogenase-like uncharacterized protein
VKKNWMIYGATGLTGELIVREAVKQGHRPVIAGRSEGKLKALAEELKLEWLAFSLDDTKQVNSAVAAVELVLNAAGPFSRTAQPLVEACLAEATHYLDIANEIGIFEQIYKLHNAALEKNIVLIPGVGFGTVATNFLAKQVSEKLENPVELEVAMYIGSDKQSAGAGESTLEVIAGGGKVYRRNKLSSFRLGKGAKKINLPDGQNLVFMPVPLGDLAAAYRVTGIPNIKAYTSAPANSIFRLALPLVQQMLKIGTIRRQMLKSSAKPSKPTTQKPEKEIHSYSWAVARDSRGNEAEAWLEMGDGYQFTAMSSVQAVTEVLEKRPVGSLSPAQAFGEDFIRTIEGASYALR